MVGITPYINVWQLLTVVHVLALCWPLYWFLSDTSIHEGIDGVSDILIGKNVTTGSHSRNSLEQSTSIGYLGGLLRRSSPDIDDFLDLTSERKML